MNKEISQGTQGVQGFQGVQGVQGEKGTASPGVPGEKGEQGEQGIQGTQGSQGRQGKIQRSAILGYLILTIGMVLGIYFVSQNSSNQLKKKINTIVEISCKNELKPSSNTSKFNDLIDSIIKVRTETRDEAKTRGDIQIVKINNEAIRRYQLNKITPKTIKQCEKVLIP